MAPTILKNARIFTSTPESEEPFAGSIVFEDGLIRHVGSDDSSSDELEQARAAGAREIDVANRVVAPGFIDGHVHILQFGQAQGKLDVMQCKSLEEIRKAVGDYAAANPSLTRILCKGWIQASTASKALASMIDDLDPRPIYIEALDLHSIWVNTAAIDELGVAEMEDPPGGTIHRDDKGRPTGLLSEAAMLLIVFPFLASHLTPEETTKALKQGFAAFSEAGYTGVVDMAMDEKIWSAIDLFRKENSAPLHVAAHWLMPPSESDAETQAHLNKAIEMNQRFHPSKDPSFCVVGVKMITDGVVDSCTAALSKPYEGNSDVVKPIWSAEALKKVVHDADAADLQCAIHAIGDQAITQAVDAIAALKNPARRHRIEHLELASAEDAKRLGKLGITASVQPVHSDPALFKAWPSLLGARCHHAFPYKEFLDVGAPMAIGTDTPTAAHFPLPNLYNATTRRSAIEPESTERTNPQFAIPLAAAIKAATLGSAYSRFAEGFIGSLKEGLSADFVVLDTDFTPEGLLSARVQQTWFRGKKVFEARA